MSAGTQVQATIRDRVIELRRVNRGEVLPNRHNFRTHPDNQRAALKGILKEIGIAGAGLAYYSARNDNKLTFIDGHLRDEEIPASFPVLITDLTDSEADLLLASYDPLGALAQADRAILDSLLDQVETSDATVQEMLAGLARQNQLYETGGDDLREVWRGMPEFNQPDAMPKRTIQVHFYSDDAVEDFARLVNQTITDKTKYINHPYRPPQNLKEFAVEDES